MTSDEAAKALANRLLSMRIEIRKLSFDHHGLTKSSMWREVYDAMREYEDAQVRDMLANSQERRRRHRRRKKTPKPIPQETRRKPSGIDALD